MTNRKEQAFKYFRGIISTVEERDLHDWVKEDPANYAILHSWEKEWAAAESDSISGKWGEMLGRIAVRHTVEEGELRIDRRPRGWLYASIAVVAAIFVAALAIYSFAPMFNRPAQLYSTEAPAGEKCRVILPDNTTVWLNSGSRLSYDDSYSRKERNVRLVGEGYFEVAKDDEHPFIVDCGDASVLVKGTKFNVSAYPEDSQIITGVVDGHVVFSHGAAHVDLFKGQSATYNILTKVFSRSKKAPSNLCAWTESRFVYENINLSELAEKISRTYAVKFHFNTTEYLEDEFTISLRNNETLADVLNALERIIPVRAVMDGENVYINKK